MKLQNLAQAACGILNWFTYASKPPSFFVTYLTQDIYFQEDTKML